MGQSNFPFQKAWLERCLHFSTLTDKGFGVVTVTKTTTSMNSLDISLFLYLLSEQSNAKDTEACGNSNIATTIFFNQCMSGTGFTQPPENN
jgi:hypothetical protein